MLSAPPLIVSIALAFGISAPVAPTATSSETFMLRRAPSLSISTPISAALGSTRPGNTITAPLGTVTVDDTRLLLAGWTATVSATDFTTGAGSAALTIGKSMVSYWSGPVTASLGIAVRTPGQATAALAQNLSVPRTAFSKRSGVLGTSTSWNPTLVVTVPATAITGTYRGTVMHSVA